MGWQIKGPICKFFENRFFSENSSKRPNAHMASEIGIILAQLEGKNVNRAFRFYKKKALFAIFTDRAFFIKNVYHKNTTIYS